MTDLVLVGAGAFARELLSWIRDINLHSPTWNVVGYLAPEPTTLKFGTQNLKYLGTELEYSPKKGSKHAIAIGKPAIKAKVYSGLQSKQAEFANVIHPSVVIGQHNQIEQGLIACPGVIISSDTIIGRCVTLNMQSIVSHDVIIGDFCQISNQCDLTGGVELGTEVFLGSGARIVPGKKVGDRSSIGAYSIIMKDINSDSVTFVNSTRTMSKPSED